VGSADEVEYVADWRGPVGELATALLDCGFLDKREDGQLEIHDLHDNAPDYVRARYRMEKYRAKVRSGEVDHPNQHGYVTVTQPERNEPYPGYGSPTPTPTPVEKRRKIKVTASSGQPAAERPGARDEAFDLFWSSYPRKVAKAAALKAWAALVNGERETAIVAARAWTEAWAGAPDDRRRFLPHPATWLRAHRWEDSMDDVRHSARGNGAPHPPFLDVGRNDFVPGPETLARIREIQAMPRREDE
jgi:hypothetical protein